MATGSSVSLGCYSEHSIASTNVIAYTLKVRSSPRPISTGRLNTSPCLHLRPINLVVYQGPYPVNTVGGLISKRDSGLDPFSAQLLRRSQPNHVARARPPTLE